MRFVAWNRYLLFCLLRSAGTCSVSGNDLIKTLNEQVKKLDDAYQDLQAGIYAKQVQVEELTNELEDLKLRVQRMSQEQHSLRENAKAQIVIDSAKVVARMLMALDSSLGPTFSEKSRIMDLASRVGVYQISNAGLTERFNFEEFDDPENQVQPGDSIRVIAPGYLFIQGEQRVVLAKALIG